MKKNIWVITAFLVTFLLGLFAGYLIPRKPFGTSQKKEWRDERHDRDKDRRDWEQRHRDHMAEQLQLEDQQRPGFDSLSIAFNRSIRGILNQADKETREKIRIQSDSLNIQMRNLLSDEQFQRWDEMNKARDKAFERRR